MIKEKNLPNGWAIKPMTEVVTWGSGGTPKATESQYYDNGDIPWLIIGDLNDGVVTESQSKITELGLKNIFNYRSAKATREQLAESKRQFEENNRAFVTVTFETIRGSLLVLNIHNHGHQVANNVSVKINPEFIANVPDKEYLVKLCESSFTLGVDKSWFVCFGGTPELGKISNIPLKITICYSDIFSTYSESTTIDLKQYLWSIIYDSPTEDTYQEMKKMTKSIQSMDKSIQKLQKRMDAFDSNRGEVSNE